jgi:hypothetical protein
MLDINIQNYFKMSSMFYIFWKFFRVGEERTPLSLSRAEDFPSRGKAEIQVE